MIFLSSKSALMNCVNIDGCSRPNFKKGFNDKFAERQKYSLKGAFASFSCVMRLPLSPIPELEVFKEKFISSFFGSLVLIIEKRKLRIASTRIYLTDEYPGIGTEQ